MRQDAPTGKREHAVVLFDAAARGYDRMARLLTFGQYDRWTRALVAQARAAGVGSHARVLDLATGTGLVAEALVAATGATVVGVDQSVGMLQAARRRAGGGGSPRRSADRLGASLSGRYRPAVATADHLPFPDATFDAATFTYLLRYVDDPGRTLREVTRVVRPGGFVGFVEFHLPSRPWRPLWRAHTRVVLPLAGRFVSRGWREVGDFLGPSIEAFWRERDLAALRDAMRAAGLHLLDHRLLSLGGGLVAWGRKEGTP